MKYEYYKTKETVKEYIKLAEGVNGSKLIDKLKAYLPVNSTLLEIGSGPGTDFQILKKDFQVTGSDYSKVFLSHLMTNNKNDQFLELDAKTLKTIKKFDGIYSNKVLQHLTDDDLSASIKRQTEILKKNGIVCHSFWSGEGDEIFKGMLVNYQSVKSLKKLFENYFDILLLSEYEEFEKEDSILLIGRKK